MRVEILEGNEDGDPIMGPGPGAAMAGVLGDFGHNHGHVIAWIPFSCAFVLLGHMELQEGWYFLVVLAAATVLEPEQFDKLASAVQY